MKMLLVVAATILLAAGCSHADHEPRSRATPAPVATGFVNGGTCPTRCKSVAGALTVYARVGDDDKPVSWRMRVGDVDQRLHAGNEFSYPRAIGEVDIDSDGRPEWLVKTYDLAGHGTNWQQLGLFVLFHGRLSQVTFEDEPLAVRVGGISRMGEGASCTKDRLILLRTVAENRRNTRWSYSKTRYRLDGTEVHREGRRRGLLELRGYNDPKLDPFYAIDCDGLKYP